MSSMNPQRPGDINIRGISRRDRTRLLQTPLLENMVLQLQRKLLSIGTVRSLRKGEFLFMAGDTVDSIACLISGTLKELYSTETGEVCLRRILAPPNCISLHLLFAQHPHIHSYSCEAVSEVRCFCWKTRAFLDILLQEPSLGYQVGRVLSGYFENSCRLNCLCRKTQAVSRVAGYLLRQCSPLHPNCLFFNHSDKLEMRVNIRPLGLTANDICLARETFSRALSTLQDRNIIRMENGVVDIIDLDALKSISGIQ